MNQEEFTSNLEGTVDAKVAEILATKDDGNKYLGYMDAITMSSSIRNVFRNKLDVIPPQIEAAIILSEVVLAPSQTQREEAIKKVLSIAGGAGGLAMIIGGVGAALGWGAGVVAAVVAFFGGISLAGPIAWITVGVAVAAVAAYFAFVGNDETNSERYLKCLKNTLKEAMPHVWAEHGDKLSQD